MLVPMSFRRLDQLTLFIPLLSCSICECARQNVNVDTYAALCSHLSSELTAPSPLCLQKQGDLGNPVNFPEKAEPSI